MTEGVRSVAEAEVMARLEEIDAGVIRPGNARSDTLLIEADGCMAHVDGAWHEVKTGLVASLGPQLVLDERTGQVRSTAGDAHCVAGTPETKDPFFARLFAQAVAQGLGGPEIRQVVLLSDGADWIFQGAIAYLSLPGVRVAPIVDVFHAKEHLCEVANTVYGEGTPRAKTRAKRWGRRLERDGPLKVIDALNRLTPRTMESREAVRLGLHYFETRKDRMRYPEYRAAHLPIGSGAVESACKLLPPPSRARHACPGCLSTPRPPQSSGAPPARNREDWKGKDRNPKMAKNEKGGGV